MIISILIIVFASIGVFCLWIAAIAQAKEGK